MPDPAKQSQNQTFPNFSSQLLVCALARNSLPSHVLTSLRRTIKNFVGKVVVVVSRRVEW